MIAIRSVAEYGVVQAKRMNAEAICIGDNELQLQWGETAHLFVHLGFGGAPSRRLHDPAVRLTPDVQRTKIPSPVDFADPVLNRRQILLLGDIDEKAAERTIQKLLFFLRDNCSHAWDRARPSKSIAFSH